MPIYSRNSVGGGVRITANENYSYEDMGRILFESAQNDMILFNAVMANDFKEAAAIREGTMIGSELESLREFSVKEAWAGLKAKLKKLWEKIKGVFRQVYAKLGVWFVRNGKMFQAMNQKILANKTGLGDCEIPLYLKETSKKPAGIIDSIGTNATQMMSTIANGSGKNPGSDNACDQLLTKAFGKDVTSSSVAKDMKDACYTEMEKTTYSAISSQGGDYNQLFSDITGKGKAIKDLKDTEKRIDKSIKEMIRKLDESAAKANKEKENSGNNYSNASRTCAGYEKALTLATRAGISAIKAKVANSRQIIGKLVAYTPKGESAVLEETAWLEGADDFATMEDIPAEDFNDSDVQEDSDVVVNIDIDSDGDECGANC